VCLSFCLFIFLSICLPVILTVHFHIGDRHHFALEDLGFITSGDYTGSFLWRWTFTSNVTLFAYLFFYLSVCSGYLSVCPFWRRTSFCIWGFWHYNLRRLLRIFVMEVNLHFWCDFVCLSVCLFWISVCLSILETDIILHLRILAL
jgi:hypothetical protein